MYTQNNNAHTDKKRKASTSSLLEACFPLSLKAAQERTSVYLKHAKHPAKSKDEPLHFVLLLSPAGLVCIKTLPHTQCTEDTGAAAHLAHLLALQQSKRSSTRGPSAAPASAVLPQVHHAQHVVWRSMSIQCCGDNKPDHC